MRKTFLILSAIALVGLASCQKPAVEQNPDYNAETDEVLTNFVLSVSTGGGAATKMSPEAVQANGSTQKFWGIDSAKIVLYNTTIQLQESPTIESGKEAADYVQFMPFVTGTNSDTYVKTFALGHLYSATDITPADNATSSSNRILKLNVPTGVTTALFYGKAAGNGQGSNTRGYLCGKVDADPNNTFFTAVPRINNVSAYDATGRLMIYIINQILGTKVLAQTAGAEYIIEYNNVSYPFSGLGELSWKSLGERYKDTEARKTLTPLGEVLGKSYVDFTTIKDGEYRAGSSAAIKAQMEDIYVVIEAALNTKPTSDTEANAHRLASAIQTNMNLYYTNQWTYKSIDELRTGDNPVISDAIWSSENLEGAKDINRYPESFNIPAGAAQITVDDNGKMKYIDPNRPLVNQSATEFYPYQYYYPVELAYYTNSALRTTEKANLAVGDFPDGTTPWAAEAWTNWKYPRAVKSTTTGVAIANNIHYGVAMLETIVKYSDGWLEDNKHAMTGDPDNKVIQLADARLNLTGVLVGGVCSKVNWQFLRRDESESTVHDDNIPYENKTKYPGFDSYKFNNVIYDDAVNELIPASGTTNPNYTLVFDNFNSTGELVDNLPKQNDVYVALEFQNNGDPFWGKHNIIGSGMKFYLVGKLSPKPAKLNAPSETQEINWPNDFQIPPIYDANGKNPASAPAKPGDSMKIPRVFIQDFVTKATFKISKFALQNAYVSMPDMSQAQMSLGLSVDLSWQNGYEYEIDFANFPF